MGEIVTPAADVYSPGNVIYQMLTGHPPFDGDSPLVIAMQHIQDVPTPPTQLNTSIPTSLEGITASEPRTHPGVYPLTRLEWSVQTLLMDNKHMSYHNKEADMLEEKIRTAIDEISQRQTHPVLQASRNRCLSS